MSPLTIEIMFACYTSPFPATKTGPWWDTPAAIEAREFLLSKGLINTQCEATERGKVWVEMICATPLPIRSWKDPRKD